MNKFVKIAWFSTKAAIGGGVVYITVDQGIWGNSRSTSAAYDRLYDIMPGTKSVSEKYLHFPKKDDVNINFRSYWNTGVFYTFDFVANFPSKVGSLKDYIVDFASSPPGDVSKNEEVQKTDDNITEKKEENSTIKIQTEKSD
ncbi:hypothetical protein Pcinc_029220 [Petrolisthes cinctipes]|uniref:MICOS complex subunit MIC13 n=1 Tax=Petrolisthes cinctipes TaxID=88211 RepID=A0AAE1F1G6_PETCI|nr:hypothetical protein Pcinc_029220 [Petrolisthes cinctipes]